MRYVRWKARIATVVVGTMIPWIGSASAQMMPIPDDTLGEESSTVRTVSPEFPTDIIEGGSRQGDALFHSFEALSVEEGRAVYFSDPGVDSILSRVTGEAESQILGVLGVLGDADLFLINPNGIIFGQNARLDLGGGSFLATSADSVELNGDFEFSSSDAGLSTAPLLRVRPSAFLFNRENPAGIVNNASTSVTSRTGALFDGLRVADGERLTLLGGDITLDNGELVAHGGRIEVGGLSEPGKVLFNADGSLEFLTDAQRSDVVIGSVSRITVSDSTVSGGSVAVMANTLEINGSSRILAGTARQTRFVDGEAGDITLDAITIRVVGSSVDNIVQGPSGNGGDIFITADELLVSENSAVQSLLLQSLLLGEGRAGKVTIDVRGRTTIDNSLILSNRGVFNEIIDTADEANTIEITTSELLLTGESLLESGFLGRGDAGRIVINASASAVLDGSFISGGAVLNTLDNAEIANGGTIQIETPNLVFTNGAGLSSTTGGSRGNSGNIQLTTGSLSLSEGSFLSTSSSGTGSAGNIFIETQGHTVLDDQSSMTSTLGQISGSAVPVGNAADARRAGNIELTVGSLDLLNGSQLQSTTDGLGDAGNVTVRARDRIFIGGIDPEVRSLASTIFAITRDEAEGEGGDVSLTADSVRIADNGLISTTTSNRFAGGNVAIEANTLDLTGGGRILTTTGGSGRAGNINLDIAERTTLTGENIFKFDSNNLFFSGFYASTTQRSSGSGGAVRLSTPELQVLDQARIEVDSQGSGIAGNMMIAADTVQLDNGRLTAETAAVDGGNIALEDIDLLLLRNGSLISTTAGTAGAGGNGGNIDIESNVIFAIPNENIDIRANAFSGSGGRVGIDTSGIFGIDAQSQDNPLTNDITASSEQGVQGTVDIETPETDPRSGITELPATFADASNQITQTCAGNSDGQDSEFVITGRGGLPSSPIDTLVSDTPLSNWATLDDETADNTLRPETANAPSDPMLSTEERIVEAQGWTRENGNVKLVAEAPTSITQTAMACQ